MQEKKIHLILFGPPGSGKGTQAKSLVERYQLVHISTGDLFRSEIGNKTPLGIKAQEYMDKGELVPDAVTIGMLQNKVNQHPEAKGFIYDGFPRTDAQAQALDTFLGGMNAEINCLLALSVDDEEIVKRIKLRGEESGREDDKDEAVIRKRIQVYKDNTLSVFEYYHKQGKAKKIDGLGSIEEIGKRLHSALDQSV